MTDTGRKDENDRKRLRDQELPEVFTHTNTPTPIHTTYKHGTSFIVYIYLWMPPLYGTPSLSPSPTDQPLHVLPYCPNWFCTIPLHCSTSIFEHWSRYLGVTHFYLWAINLHSLFLLLLSVYKKLIHSTGWPQLKSFYMPATCVINGWWVTVGPLGTKTVPKFQNSPHGIPS